MWYGAWLGVFEGMRSGRYIRKDLNFQDENVLWAQLLKARTVAQVRAVCKASPFWLNPKRGSTTFYQALIEDCIEAIASSVAKRCPGMSERQVRYCFITLFDPNLHNAFFKRFREIYESSRSRAD